MSHKPKMSKLNKNYKFYRVLDDNILTCGHTFGYMCDQWSRDHPLLCSPKGLAEAVSTTYPHAYSYPKGDRTNFKVGEINTHRSPRVGIPTIIELYAQRYGGGAKWGFGETKVKRLQWFRQCLLQVDNYLRTHFIRNFALPYNIGCSREKGNWVDYEAIINDFARIGQMGEDPFEVYLVRLPTEV
jgi:hypothetical protein